MGEESQYFWLHKLNGYAYWVEYKKGKDNIVVDDLSRREEEGKVLECAAINIVEPAWLIERGVRNGEKFSVL